MIETERLILRSFTEEDVHDLYEVWENPEINCFESEKITSEEQAREVLKEKMKNPEYDLAVILKETGEIIGEMESIPQNMAHGSDEPADTCCPCWILKKKYQKKGYAYEAAHAYFRYLFEEKNIRRIYAYTEEDNLSSQSLCERLGMRKEGVFVEFVSFVKNPDGTPHMENTIQYAILKKEWEHK